MTSLIDVVLLLLIFFMMSTRFVDERHIEIRLPESGSFVTSVVDPDTVEISVSGEGRYSVNGHPLIDNSVETLKAAVKLETGADRSAPILIRADGRASHQAVTTALDAAGQLGHPQINIATSTEED
jgi:biopolymer transport protein ExbD